MNGSRDELAARVRRPYDSRALCKQSLRISLIGLSLLFEAGQ